MKTPIKIPKYIAIFELLIEQLSFIIDFLKVNFFFSFIDFFNLLRNISHFLSFSNILNLDINFINADLSQNIRADNHKKSCHYHCLPKPTRTQLRNHFEGTQRAWFIIEWTWSKNVSTWEEYQYCYHRSAKDILEYRGKQHKSHAKYW